MPSIVPISDSKNCNTQNYDKIEAQLKLMRELAAGRKSGEENGWISAKDVRNHFKKRANAK